MNFYPTITIRFYAFLNLSSIVSQAFFGINLKDKCQDKAVLKYTKNNKKIILLNAVKLLKARTLLKFSTNNQKKKYTKATWLFSTRKN